MTDQKTEKVRRYQAARTRLPSIRLTTADRDNLATCLTRHGTTAEAVKCAVAHLIERYAGGGDAESQPAPGEPTGDRLQSVFLPSHYAEAWRIVSHDCGSASNALRQALHEYATRITKAPKQPSRLQQSWRNLARQQQRSSSNETRLHHQQCFSPATQG